jgi:hypothetical protein
MNNFEKGIDQKELTHDLDRTEELFAFMHLPGLTPGGTAPKAKGNSGQGVIK